MIIDDKGDIDNDGGVDEQRKYVGCCMFIHKYLIMLVSSSLCFLLKHLKKERKAEREVGREEGGQREANKGGNKRSWESVAIERLVPNITRSVLVASNRASNKA